MKKVKHLVSKSQLRTTCNCNESAIAYAEQIGFLNPIIINRTKYYCPKEASEFSSELINQTLLGKYQYGAIDNIAF